MTITEQRGSKLEEIFEKDFDACEGKVLKQLKKFRRKYSSWKPEKQNRDKIDNWTRARISLVTELHKAIAFLDKDLPECIKNFEETLPPRVVRGKVVVDLSKDAKDDEIIPTQDLTKTEDVDVDYNQTELPEGENKISKDQVKSTDQLHEDPLDTGETIETDPQNADTPSKRISPRRFFEVDRTDLPTDKRMGSHSTDEEQNTLDLQSILEQEAGVKEECDEFEEDAETDQWRLSLPPAAAAHFTEVIRTLDSADDNDKDRINTENLHVQQSYPARAPTPKENNGVSGRGQEETESLTPTTLASSPIKRINILCSRSDTESEDSTAVAEPFVASLAQLPSELSSRPSKKPRVKDEADDLWNLDVFSLTHEDIDIPKSTGRPRKGMVKLLDGKFGIHASMANQSAICTKQNRISHLVLDDQWNEFCRCREENQILHVGTGRRRREAAGILMRTETSFPVFFHPKRNNVRHCIFYVGHFRVVQEKSKLFDEAYMYKNHDRISRIELAFDNFDERIAEAVKPNLINISMS